MRIRNLAAATVAAVALVTPAITPAAHAAAPVVVVHTSDGAVPRELTATTLSSVVIHNLDSSSLPDVKHTYRIDGHGTALVQDVYFGTAGVIVEPFTNGPGEYTLYSDGAPLADITVTE